MAGPDEVWTMEERLWTGGRAAYEGAVSAEAVFAFPSGLMAGNGFVAGLPEAAGWASVEMGERREGAPSPDLRVIAYSAIGTKPDGAIYRTLCSSTYVRSGEGWQLVQHSQTPMPDGDRDGECDGE